MFRISLFLTLKFCLILPCISEPDVPANYTTRAGWKYLGYYLTALGAAIGGANGNYIQTIPVTSAPANFQTVITGLPVISTTQAQALSPFPTAMTFPPVITSIPGGDEAGPNDPPMGFPPVITSIPDGEDHPNDPDFISTFPTAPPSSFPTGVFTSLSTLPSTVAVAQTIFPSGNTVGVNGALQCNCVTAALCVNRANRAGGIDVRIVTTAPSGVTCAAGEVYCCTQTSQFSCGLQNIVGGVNPAGGQADFGEYPWSALMLDATTGAFLGGATIVGTNHVLTVAHRVSTITNPARVKVRVGDWDLNGTYEPSPYAEFAVTSIAIHPNFDATSLRNDLAILTLASAIPLLTTQLPQANSICLPDTTAVFTGARCWVAGWGKDQFNGNFQNILKEVDLPVLGSVNCQNRLRQTRLGSSFQLDTTSFLCAGGEANKDACTGDGGSALACSVNGRFFLAGITVGGINCGLANVPGLYANIVNFVPWINSQIITNTGIDPRKTRPG